MNLDIFSQFLTAFLVNIIYFILDICIISVAFFNLGVWSSQVCYRWSTWGPDDHNCRIFLFRDIINICLWTILVIKRLSVFCQVHDVALGQFVTVLVFEFIHILRGNFLQVISGSVFFQIIIMIKHEFLDFLKLKISILSVSWVLTHVAQMLLHITNHSLQYLRLFVYRVYGLLKLHYFFVNV